MTGKQRRGAIGVIVRDEKFLVIERSMTVRAPGKFCFPGGEMEKGETEEAAVQRELQEELGIAVEPHCRLWECETQSGVHLNWWLVSFSLDQTPKPNSEVASYCWMPIEEVEKHPKTLLTNRLFARAVISGAIVIPVSGN